MRQNAAGSPETEVPQPHPVQLPGRIHDTNKSARRDSVANAMIDLLRWARVVREVNVSTTTGSNSLWTSSNPHNAASPPPLAGLRHPRSRPELRHLHHANELQDKPITVNASPGY